MFEKFCIICFIISYPELLTAQTKKGETTVKEKYISFNIPALAEPHLAIGPSAGIRVTDRSELFTEAAFVTLSPFNYVFNADIDKLRGARLILQYRYHFLQQWRPLFNIKSASKQHRSIRQPFVAAEFRLKPLSFNTQSTLVNYNTNDTLHNYPFRANTITLGGALIFGNTFNLSSDGKWKLEFSAGLGAKHRLIRKNTLPAGYQLPFVERIAFQLPRLYEETGTAIFPVAVRLRYLRD